MTTVIGRPPTERQTATAWLTAYLAGGPVLATQVYRAALAAGHKRHTLRRAADGMGVVKEPRSGPTCHWALSGAPASVPRAA